MQDTQRRKGRPRRYVDPIGLYFAVMTGWPRRFCCQQPSCSSKQAGDSSPLLTTKSRSAVTPRLTKYSLTARAQPSKKPSAVCGREDDK